MNQARVSVIVTLYNKGPYIRRYLDSILGQRLSRLELIVVDDGSTDHGLETVRRIDDPRVKLISQPNAGLGAARNRGGKKLAGNCSPGWMETMPGSRIERL
jgi:glycosyltransferase involved in cell wall biosynthesis